MKDPSVLFDSLRFARFSGVDHTLGDLGDPKQGERVVYIWPSSIAGWVEVDGMVGSVHTDTGTVGLPRPVTQKQFLEEVQRAQQHVLDLSKKVRDELLSALMEKANAAEESPSYTFINKLTDKIGGGESN